MSDTDYEKEHKAVDRELAEGKLTEQEASEMHHRIAAEQCGDWQPSLPGEEYDMSDDEALALFGSKRSL